MHRREQDRLAATEQGPTGLAPEVPICSPFMSLSPALMCHAFQALLVDARACVREGAEEEPYRGGHVGYVGLCWAIWGHEGVGAGEDEPACQPCCLALFYSIVKLSCLLHIIPGAIFPQVSALLAVLETHMAKVALHVVSIALIMCLHSLGIFMPDQQDHMH